MSKNGMLGRSQGQEEGDSAEMTVEPTLNGSQLRELMDLLGRKFSSKEEGVEMILKYFFPEGDIVWGKRPLEKFSLPPLFDEFSVEGDSEAGVRTYSMIELKPSLFFAVGESRVKITFPDAQQSRESNLKQSLAKIFLDGFLRNWENGEEQKDNRQAVALLIHNNANQVAAVLMAAEMEATTVGTGGEPEEMRRNYRTMITAAYEQVKFNSALALRLLRTGERKIKPELKVMSLVDLLKNFHQKFVKHSFHGNLETTDGLEGTVAVDLNLLMQVMENLVGNAYKYGHPSDQPLEITLNKMADKLMISIRDEGRGIGDEDPEKLFEFAYRAPQHKDQSGHGIGLYFCRQVVEELGGRINLLSNAGRKGVNFEISLPLR